MHGAPAEDRQRRWLHRSGVRGGQWPHGSLHPLALADGPRQRFALELKVWRRGRPDPVEEGLRQLGGYLERRGLDRGTLILFDQRADAPPFAERGTRESKTVSGREILVLRL